MLKAQVEKAQALGLEPMFGSELEFFLFRESYLEAHAKHYHDLTPSVPYILDYHILAASFDEPFLRTVRTSMKAAGMIVESSKGEAWAGQHEINFRFRDALRAADDHAVYKTGIKEIAFQNGCSVTFMAKPHHDWVGSSCHIHSSLWRDGENAFAGESELFRHYLAGQIACLARPRDLRRADRQLVQALRGGELGADHARLGLRQPHLRLPRRRSRLLGAAGDADPRRRREPVPRVRGAARRRAVRDRARARARAGARGQRVRSRTRSGSRTRCARRSPGSSRATVARELLGDEVVDHYLNYARTEQELFDRTVTGYERERMFERG